VAKPVVFTPHGLTFKVPVTLTIPYASASADLVVLRLDDERDTTWEVLPATFEGGKARVQTTRFSVDGGERVHLQPRGLHRRPQRGREPHVRRRRGDHAVAAAR
jgi:hypothetical protein